MKIIVNEMLGDASVIFYNKLGDQIHVEGFYGKTDSSYIRDLPIDPSEYGSHTALFNKKFDYKVVFDK